MALHVPINYINERKQSAESMKAIALYLKIKKRWKNGCVYAYTPDKLSVIKVSNYEARKYVGCMVRLGLAERQKNGTLKLHSFRTLKEDGRRSKPMSVHFTDSLKTVVTKLRYAILKDQLIDRQTYIKNINSDLVLLDKKEFTRGDGTKISMKATLRRMKKLKKRGHDFSCPETVDVKIGAGYRKMAMICGLSTASMKEMFKTLTKWRYIKGIRYLIVEQDLDANVASAAIRFDAEDRGRMWIRGSRVFKHLGTEILL